MTARPRVADRTAVVTGATSGVGLACARALLADGWRVVAAVRDVSKARALLPQAEAMEMDLARLASVRAFAQAFRARHDRIHLLLNNAGIHTARRVVTEDGHELTFQTNHLGHFLLTRGLLDVLRGSAPARVVTVASEAHWLGRLDFDDLMGERRWSGVKAYCQSKLANVEFSYELARRLQGTGVTANAAHPGSVRTGWARGEDSGLLRLGVKLATPVLVSPETAAARILRVCTDPALEGVTGRYFVRGREARSAPWSRREEDWRRLWEESERLGHSRA